MWRAYALALLIWCQPAWALGDTIREILTPSPFTIALEIGKWIVRDRETLYQVRVQGAGPDEQQARQQAFALAVDEALGSLIFAQTDIENNAVTRHRVLRYNSGYVHSFRIVDRMTLPTGEVAVQMDVWVRHARLSEGLLAQGSAIDRSVAATAQAALDTLSRESGQGTALLAAVLEDYPQRALDIKDAQTQIVRAGEQRAAVRVKATVTWRPSYIDSLAGALRTTQQLPMVHDCVWQNHKCQGRQDGTFAVTLWQPQDTAHRPSGRYGFADSERFAVIWRSLVQTLPMLRIELTDYQGRRISVQCQALEPSAPLANSYYANAVHVNGSVRVPVDITLAQPLSRYDLDNLADARLTITARC